MTDNALHRCELCEQPACHQTWSVVEARYINTCTEHEPVAIPECTINHGEDI